jgi:predicted phosphatase
LKCLYLTDVKPSRKGVREFTDWLQANYPDCSFTEVNVGRQAHPVQNGGRYQGRVDGPATWNDSDRAADRLAVLDAARRMLAT